jgi:hypothetical protein
MLMRWAQADPYGFGGGDVNFYRVEENEPLIATDPDGTKAKRHKVTVTKPTTVTIPPDVLAQYEETYTIWWTRYNYPPHRTFPLTPCGSNYPPGWLKKDTVKVAIITDVTDPRDGFLWIKEENQHRGVSGYEALKEALRDYTDGSIDLLVLSGHGSMCGVAGSVNSFNQNMPADIAAFIRSKLSSSGTVVIAGCDSGNNARWVQLFADKLRCPVSAAKDDCRGLRTEYFDWAMGGYAEGGYSTKKPRRPKDR